MFINRRFIAVFFVLLGGLSKSQIITTSPYSVYGIGEIESKGSALSQGMGDLKYSLVGNYILNNANPASYTWLTQPSLNIEINQDLSIVSAGTVESRKSTVYFKQAVLGLPITKKWWGSAIGIIPKSKTGYSFTASESVENSGSVVYDYTGKGGINEVFWGNGFNLLTDSVQQLSIGITGSYLFGSIDKTKQIKPSSGYYLSVNERIEVSDFAYEAGLIYSRQLTTSWRSSLGLSYGYGSNLKGIYSKTIQSYTESGFNIVTPKDTIETDTTKGKLIQMPSRYSGGVSFYLTNKLIIGIDYSFENWSKFTLFNRTITYSDRHDIAIGAQYLPNPNAVRGFFNSVRYRAGARYALSSLNLNGNQITEYGITFGLGIPIGRRSKSQTSINIAYEYGQRGENKGQLAKETFSSFNLGLVLTPGKYDRWFVKPRID